jgi:hypothetical protein
MTETAARRRAFGAAAVAVALLVLSACGGTTGGDGVASAEGDADPANNVDTEPRDEDAQALVFAECMRDNGVDMPDPGPGQQGFYEAFHGIEGSYDRATVEQAVDACQDLMPQFAAEDHGDDEAVLALAECLRDQGLEVPDNLFESGALHDVEQDELMAAMEECRDVVAGGGG